MSTGPSKAKRKKPLEKVFIHNPELIVSIKRAAHSKTNEAFMAELGEWQDVGFKSLLVSHGFDSDAMRYQFPNFKPVIDFFDGQSKLSEISGSWFRSRPVLLLGDPGIGKTRFAKTLAAALGMEFGLVQCGTVTAGFVLGGLSSAWSNSKPGEVSRMMKRFESANPMIMLDEIDKLAGQKEDGFGPLYSLLENETARKFKDEFLDMEIDCSHCSFIATANDISCIPEAIVSRFKVIKVESPTFDEMREIVLSIYLDTLHSNPWGGAFDQMPPETIDEIAKGFQTPRRAVDAVLEACGNAAMAHQGDGKIVVLPEHVRIHSPKRRVGF